jgi:hypothetical protein
MTKEPIFQFVAKIMISLQIINTNVKMPISFTINITITIRGVELAYQSVLGVLEKGTGNLELGGNREPRAGREPGTWSWVVKGHIKPYVAGYRFRVGLHPKLGFRPHLLTRNY